MAIEKKWQAVAPKLLTSDGGQFGQINVADTRGFKVKQAVVLKATGLPDLPVQIKRFVSKTQFLVGPIKATQGTQGLQGKTDCSAYTVLLGAMVYAEEQDRAKVPPEDIAQSVYRQEPACAIATTLVDEFGDEIDKDNPLPVAFDGTISIGEVEVVGTNGNIIEPNADGSINVNIQSSPTTNQATILRYNEVLALASGSQVTLVSYTVPPAKTAILMEIMVSGANIARYDVWVNGITKATKRTYFGGNLNADFDFPIYGGTGVELNAGDVVLVKVIHGRPMIADFEGTIQVVEIT